MRTLHLQAGAIPVVKFSVLWHGFFKTFHTTIVVLVDHFDTESFRARIGHDVAGRTHALLSKDGALL